MKLIKYQVSNFRSVDQSGWIDAEKVTALIGVNESGKTNLLLPLWKLNPARDGELQPTSDYPKRIYGAIRANPELFCFITADFDTEGIRPELVAKTNVSEEQLDIVRVSRYYDGKHHLVFPNYTPKTTIPAVTVKATFQRLLSDLADDGALLQEESLKSDLAEAGALLQEERLKSDLADAQALKQEVTALREEVRLMAESIEQDWGAIDVESSSQVLKKHVPEQPARTSTHVPRISQILEVMDGWLRQLQAIAPSEVEGVQQLVMNALPKFVYYSNYGNLDSEIYLPHVVQNLARKDIGAKEAAKARTLRVLFSFVRLQANEILELGKDFKDTNRQPTTIEIERIAEKKRERSILLQSASTTLTQKFKEWWKQGGYRFRFEADGDHFRIWVSDDRRPEEVELENRSTGLQWFLSFYLVFLVESEGDHHDAVLLLDEPGLSLHPLAQRDLSKFFDNLTRTNQIVYTTHSPFLVDADRLDRVRKVYVSEDGTTKSSSNLRQAGADPAQAGAAYAVYSALNLNVAESLLLGCTPVVVEGASDQHYLTLIKALLISAGEISPRRELVFPPAGGTKNLRITASILTGRDEELPVVLLDSDAMGAKMATELRTSLYRGATEKVLSTDDYADFSGSEVEDLIPHDLFVEAVDRIFRNSDQPFSEHFTKGKPAIPQVEIWAKKEGIELILGWKVDVAKRVKQAALTKGIQHVEPDLVEKWVRLFGCFETVAIP